jgi:apolipoprotein N-acyltransferase
MIRDEIKRQQNLILKLQQQLRSLLFVLGINEQDIQLDANDEAADVQIEQNSNTRTNEPNVDDHQRADQSTWTEVAAKVKGPHNRQPQKPCMNAANFQQSIIAVVYADQSEQKRRASSLIVSGLQQSQTQTDKALFINLCQTEWRSTLK